MVFLGNPLKPPEDERKPRGDPPLTLLRQARLQQGIRQPVQCQDGGPGPSLRQDVASKPTVGSKNLMRAIRMGIGSSQFGEDPEMMVRRLELSTWERLKSSWEGD